MFEAVAYLGFDKGGAWRARGAQAYNGDLGGGAPSGVQGQILIAYIVSIWKQIIKHCFILQLLLENGKKCTFWYNVACKKFSWSGQSGGHRTVPPKYATGLRHNIVVFYSSCIMVLENTQLIEFLKSSNINQ